MASENPWISIWTAPRSTISKIVSENPKRGLWPLAWIYGILSLLSGSQSLSLGHSMSLLSLLLLAIVFAPLWGMAVFGIWSWVVYWVGRLLGGVGDFSFIRAAYAWSCAPLLVSLILWVLLISFFGSNLFQQSPDTHFMQQGLVILLFGSLIAKTVLSIWSLVIFINTLAEVQKFSILRSISNIILAWIAIGVVIWLVWFGFSLIH